jgi:hypothetical protein
VTDKIVINPEVTELITVTRRDSKVIVSSPGTPGPAGPAGTTDYNALTNKPDLTQYATQTYVTTAIGNLIDGAPTALDTLNELAAAVNDDSSFAATITTALGNKQDKVSGVSNTEIGYLDGVTSAIQTQLNSKLTSQDLVDYAMISYVDSSVDAIIPDQSGNSGKYLTTDGASASWAAVDLSTKQDKVTGVSDTEIGYLDGVTSAIQTQLDSKLESADLSGYATETYVDNAVGNVTIDLSTAAGTGLEWNTGTSQFDIDSTIATKAYADTAAASAAAAIVDSAPTTLNTLNELAAALGDDANYATTISTALGLKQDKVTGVSDIEIGYLDGVTSSIQDQLNAKAVYPSQSGNSGKYLTTDGSVVSWGTVATGSQVSSATPTELGTVYGNTTGTSGNVSLGQNALYNFVDTHGGNNTAIGIEALGSLVSGISNTALGYWSGNNTEGEYNSFLGSGAGQFVIGDNNTAIGQAALDLEEISVTSVNGNTALGQGALWSLATGDNNIAIGNSGSQTLESGDNNIIIGSTAEPSSTIVSNEITLGNSSITKFRIPGLDVDWDSATVPTNLIKYATSESGTTYTIQSSDIYKLKEFTSSSAITVTIPSDPTDTTFPIGSSIEIRQMGTGRIQFDIASPAIGLVSTDHYTKTRTQYSSVVLEKRASNAWILTGDIDA